MGDIVLILLFLAIYLVIWIEWAPPLLGAVMNYLVALIIIESGFSELPGGFGLALIVIGIIAFVSVYFWHKRKGIEPDPFEYVLVMTWKILGRLSNSVVAGFTWCRNNSKQYFLRRPEKSALSGLSTPRRLWFATLALVVSGPFASILAFLVVFSISTTYRSILGELDGGASGGPEIWKLIVVYPFFLALLALDIVFQFWFISVPLIVGAGFAGAKYALRSEHFYRSLFVAILVTGVIYAMSFYFINAMGWYDEPYID